MSALVSYMEKTTYVMDCSVWTTHDLSKTRGALLLMIIVLLQVKFLYSFNNKQILKEYKLASTYFFLFLFCHSSLGGCHAP